MSTTSDGDQYTRNALIEDQVNLLLHRASPWLNVDSDFTRTTSMTLCFD